MAETLIDSYSEENQSLVLELRTLHPSTAAGVYSAISQSFTGEAYKITSCKFWLKKGGSPTGNGHAVLYEHSGTFGTSSAPTGAALATSDDFDVSTLTVAYQLITFTFTGAQQYEMSADTKYCIVFENPTAGTINAANYPAAGYDDTDPGHGGNITVFADSAWTAYSIYECCFYVYGEAVAVEHTHSSSDTLAISDSLAVAAQYNVSLADTLTISDLLTVAEIERIRRISVARKIGLPNPMNIGVGM